MSVLSVKFKDELIFLYFTASDPGEKNPSCPGYPRRVPNSAALVTATIVVKMTAENF